MSPEEGAVSGTTSSTISSAFLSALKRFRMNSSRFSLFMVDRRVNHDTGGAPPSGQVIILEVSLVFKMGYGSGGVKIQFSLYLIFHQVFFIPFIMNNERDDPFIEINSGNLDVSKSFVRVHHRRNSRELSCPSGVTTPASFAF
jgi:hypothetical protein